MEGLILVTTLFLCLLTLFQGIVYAYLISKIFNLDLVFMPKKKEDKITSPTGDTFTHREDRLPIDQFVPRRDMPLKVQYTKKDEYTKLK